MKVKICHDTIRELLGHAITLMDSLADLRGDLAVIAESSSDRETCARILNRLNDVTMLPLESIIEIKSVQQFYADNGAKIDRHAAAQARFRRAHPGAYAPRRLRPEPTPKPITESNPEISRETEQDEIKISSENPF